jgi:hypothetical protein
LLLDDTAGRIAREFWWTNQEFSSVDIILPWFSMPTYIWEINNRLVSGCSSEM